VIPNSLAIQFGRKVGKVLEVINGIVIGVINGIFVKLIVSEPDVGSIIGPLTTSMLKGTDGYNGRYTGGNTGGNTGGYKGGYTCG
jgi:hypothetical protein